MVYVNKKWMNENISKIELFNGTIIKNTSDGLDLPGKRFKLFLTNKGVLNVERRQCINAVEAVKMFLVKIKGEKYSATASYGT